MFLFVFLLALVNGQEHEYFTFSNYNETFIECPMDCSGTTHGKCDNQTGVCQCTDNWLGDGCEYPVDDLTSPRTVLTINMTVAGTWHYVRLSIQASGQAGQFWVIGANKTGGMGIHHIYLDYSTVPTNKSYGWFDEGIEAKKSVSLDLPASGVWFLGIFSYGGPVVLDVNFFQYFACPNSCNGHGECDTSLGRCQCDTSDGRKYQFKSDCQQETRAVTIGKAFSSTSSLGYFNYYLFFAPQNVNDMDITLELSYTPTSLTAYLQRGSDRMPTMTSYTATQRNPSDLSIKMWFPTVQSMYGPWTLGIWGHSVFSYNITIDAKTQCPQNCNLHGNCLPTTGLCKCYPSYSTYRQFDCSTFYHEDSDTSIKPVLNQTILPGDSTFLAMSTLERGVEWTISYTPPSAMLNAFVAIDYLPASNQWNSSYPCSDGSCIIKFYSADTSHDYLKFILGLYLADTITPTINFNSSLRVLSTCPNNCSSTATEIRGICSNGECTCAPHYMLPDCATYLREVGAGQPVTETIHQGDWMFFNFTVPENTTFLECLVRWDRAPKNLDDDYPLTLYISPEVFPSRVSYEEMGNLRNVLDMAATIEGKNAIVGGLWYAAVLATQDDTRFSIFLDHSKKCPKDCSNNGKCEEGECECNKNYVGDDCANVMLELYDNTMFGGSVWSNKWDYYRISVYGQNSLRIDVNTTQTDPNALVELEVYVLQMLDNSTLLPGHMHKTLKEIGFNNTIFIHSPDANGDWTVGITAQRLRTSSGLASSPYIIKATIGCSHYNSCLTCTMDPNCAWCGGIYDVSDAPVAGFDRCVSGTSVGSSFYCPTYLYDSCDFQAVADRAWLLGISTGASAGFVISIVTFLASFWAYKRWKKMQHDKLLPNVLPHRHNSIDGRSSDSWGRSSVHIPGQRFSTNSLLAGSHVWARRTAEWTEEEDSP